MLPPQTRLTELSAAEIDGLITTVEPSASPLIPPTVAVITPFVTSIADILFTRANPTPRVVWMAALVVMAGGQASFSCQWDPRAEAM
jgi:hypothetical protein